MEDQESKTTPDEGHGASNPEASGLMASNTTRGADENIPSGQTVSDQDEEDTDTETLKGILQSPHSPRDQEDGNSIEGNEDTSEEQGPESEESKRETDTSKAVTFAEDIEVYDCKAATPITVSLDTPVSQIDPVIEAEKAAQAVSDSPSEKSDGEYTNVELVPPSETAVKENSEEDSQTTGERTAARRPSLLSLNTQPAILVSNTDNVEQRPDENKSEEKVESPKQAQEKEGEHKIFSVTAVDESTLVTPKDEVEERQDNDQSQDLNADSGSVRTCSSKPGHSTDNLQDTIGPLENPAFLKTLQYTISHPYDEDEQFSVQSNMDLTSLMTGAPPDPDMDGGWAWVVLGAAFVSLAILGSSTLMAGVLMKAFLEEISPDLTKASWIGSVHIAIMSLAGPLVGMVMKKVGARLTMCLAGILMFLGFMGASFSKTILTLILSHGVVAGIGSGFAINPLYVVVGQYFNRLRGLAFGILATGVGVGLLAGCAAISQLLDSFGLSGAYLLWSAIVLHITAMGLLMQPSPEERSREAERILSVSHFKHGASQHEITSGRNSIMSGLNSIYSGTDRNSVLSGLDRAGRSRLTSLRRYSSKPGTGDSEIPLLKTVLHKEMSRSSHSVSTNRSHHHSQTQVFSPNQQRTAFSPDAGDLLNPPSPTSSVMTNTLSMNGVARPTTSSNHITSSHSLANNCLSTSTLAASQSQQQPPISPTSTRATSSRSIRPRLLSTSSQPYSYYRSQSIVSQGISFKGQSELDNQSLASALVSTLRPRDALTPRYRLGSRSISTLMGSVASFPTALSVLTDDIARLDVYGTTETKPRTIKGFIIGILDSMRVLRNKAFLIFICSCVFWALGEAPVMMYLPSYAISKGASPMQASSLYTAMGVGSIAGRFLSGLIASDANIGPILLHSGCLGLTGILVCLSPLVMNTVLQQNIFSCLLGVYTGSLVPLMTLLTIDLLGITELPLGFGFICMSQGCGYLIGPPLAGAFVTSIGFSKAFVFSGGALLGSSLLTMLIPLFIRKDDDEDDDHNSLDDLEKALNQISDSDSFDEHNEEGLIEEEDGLPENGQKSKLKYLKEVDSESPERLLISNNDSQTLDEENKRTFDTELETIKEVASKSSLLDMVSQQ